MVDVLLLILVLLVAQVLFKTLNRIELALQPSFMFALTLAILILPSAFASRNMQSPTWGNAVQMHLLLAILGTCFFGFGAYVASSRILPQKKQAGVTDRDRPRIWRGVARRCILLTCISIVARLLLVKYAPPPGVLWTGLPVYILQFARLSHITIPVAWALYILRVSRMPIALNSFNYIVFAHGILISGKRFEALTAIAVTLIPFMAIRGYRPKRAFLIAMIPAMFLIVTLFPVLRVYTRERDFQSVGTVKVWEEIETYLSGKKTNEFYENTSDLAAVHFDGGANWGRGFYNMFVKFYVPGSIVGQEFKESLKADAVSLASLRKNNNSGVHRFYIARNGFVESFIEFRWYSPILFAVLGFLFQELYRFAIVERRGVFILCYPVVLIVVSFVVYNGPPATLARFLLNGVALGWMTFPVVGEVIAPPK